MVKVISIDVGIKNLAYCILNYNKETSEYTIEYWDVINLLEEQLEEAPKCSQKCRGKICGKLATKKIVGNNTIICYCSNKKCSEIEKDYQGGGYKITNIKKITSKSVGLDEYGKAIKNQFDKRIEQWKDCEYFIIENQPVKKNANMKSIQMIIYSYFLFYGLMDQTKLIDHLVFFAARDKLKIYDGEPIEGLTNSEYKDRKKLGIIYTNYFLDKASEEEKGKWKGYLTTHSKKDDLCDCYLQGRYFIHVNILKGTTKADLEKKDKKTKKKKGKQSTGEPIVEVKSEGSIENEKVKKQRKPRKKKVE
jgi:hypothetical protein